MSKATDSNTTKWTMEEALDLFERNVLLRANFAAIAENDQYVVYSLQLPREACPDHDRLAPLANEEFNAAVAALMAEWIERG